MNLSGIFCALTGSALLIQSDALEAEDCPVTENDGRQGNAGCLIVKDNRVLLIKGQPFGKVSFPGGTARSNESAACTAYRETLEETGLDILVGEFITQLNTGFLMYDCKIPDGLYPDPLIAPTSAKFEVQGLFWADLSKLTADEWRFQEQLDEIRIYVDDLDTDN